MGSQFKEQYNIIADDVEAIIQKPKNYKKPRYYGKDLITLRRNSKVKKGKNK